MRLAEIGIVAVLATAILLSLPAFSGRLLVVLSGSMSPAINAGDLVVASSANPDEIKAGDIVVFGEGKKTITHRVINVTDAGFVTKGDANEDPDAQIRKKTDVFGKVVFALPMAGYFVNFARSPYGFVFLVIIPGIVLIMGEVRKIHFHIKNPGHHKHAPNIPKGRHIQKNAQTYSYKPEEKRKKLKVVIVKSMLLVIFSSAYVSSAYAVATGAYLSDTETSEGNTISAWTEELPECDLIVDADKARLTGNGRFLFGIWIENNQSTNITIDRMNVSWNPDGGESIKKTRIGGKVFWSGNETSGAMLDGDDYVLKPSKKKMLFIRLDSDMSGKKFTITFFMKGCKSKMVEFIPNYRSCDPWNGDSEMYSVECSSSSALSESDDADNISGILEILASLQAYPSEFDSERSFGRGYSIFDYFVEE